VDRRNSIPAKRDHAPSQRTRSDSTKLEAASFSIRIQLPWFLISCLSSCGEKMMMLFFISVTWISMTGHSGGPQSCIILSQCGIGMDFGPVDRFRQIGGTDSTAWSNRHSALKVSFDARGFVDIAFPPQIRVRWLSGRKRRFAKALYL
jgi:hypothetical protein